MARSYRSILILCLGMIFTWESHAELKFDANYEYNDAYRDRIIILVPGFTQHNRSAEFYLLKDFFRDKNFSYLIWNPPLHGENYALSPCFTWGEAEVSALKKLVDSLEILRKHEEIHLMGFSIGAKIVLKLAALSSMRESICSVIAVAAPSSVGAINMRLSGDICKINEGLISGFYAQDRAGICGLFKMILCGMPTGLAINRRSPAREIDAIKAPTILIHGLNDWLTHSSHSKHLFEQGRPDQKIAFVPLNTRTHAEDMLTRDHSTVRQNFFTLLDQWFAFVSENASLPAAKSLFQQQLWEQLQQDTCLNKALVTDSTISLMSSPTIHHTNSNWWFTAADEVHSMITVNTKMDFENSDISHYLINAGWAFPSGNWLRGLQAGFNFSVNSERTFENKEGCLSVCTHWGSFIWLRRLSYHFGFCNPLNRNIIAADLAFLVFDFQLNYGQFISGQNDWQITTHLPLISNASGNYYLGLAITHFLSHYTQAQPRSSWQSYFCCGPTGRILNTRFRFTVQYEQSDFQFTNHTRNIGAGLMLNFKER